MRVMNTDTLSYVRKNDREVPPQGQKGEEEDVSGGLTTATSTLLPLCRLGVRAAGGRGDDYPEKDIQLPGHQVAAALL